MKAEQFKYLQPFFSKNENWGDIEKVPWHHVHMLFMIRKAMAECGFDWPMIIHCCHKTDGHSENSYHYKGLATDFHFNISCPLLKQYSVFNDVLRILKLSRFVGMGVYPVKFPYSDYKGFFHIDSRGEYLRWIRVNDEYIYNDEKSIVEGIK